jgi:hypothetical protein
MHDKHQQQTGPEAEPYDDVIGGSDSATRGVEEITK